jgi:hypothetical protein
MDTPKKHIIGLSAMDEAEPEERALLASVRASIKYRLQGFTIDELLEQTDFEALADDENLNAWLNAKPIGREIL